MLKVRTLSCSCASVARITKLYVVAVALAGLVPVIVPVLLFSVEPGGSVPLYSEYETDPSPVAATVLLTGLYSYILAKLPAAVTQVGRLL